MTKRVLRIALDRIKSAVDDNILIRGLFCQIVSIILFAVVFVTVREHARKSNICITNAKTRL